MLFAVVACSATPKHRIAVTTIIEGDRRRVGALEPHAVAGLELRPFELPAVPPPPADDAPAIIAKARAAYVGGEFEACRAQLAKIDLDKLLLAEQRALAGRSIAFDAACAYGAKAEALANGLAQRLARMGLDLPDAPFARGEETLLTSAITNVGKEPRHAITVGGLAGARLFVDGKPAGCTLPCTIDAPAGDHFVAVEADGYAPVSRWLTVSKATTVNFDPRPASPALALAQWRARIGRGLAPNDAVGAKLIAQVTGQPRVAFLQGGKRVSGTMIVDGEIEATDERETAVPLVRELAYDARVLKRPALWQQPIFWIATSIAVAAVAGVVIYAVYEPDVESNLEF
ncbi:MAG: PEGA domain-containing protein [Myxococcota bacterium]|nr:PEGA domain-containing protein [Myxococcota bacterium]